MPNGGSDCCATCWFNRTNRGEAGYQHRDSPGEDHCEVRDLSIENPFYTYCANHPHRRPDRDPIPIGPVERFAGDYSTNAREVWQPSPDTEEIRRHLLDLLSELFLHIPADRYPIGPSLASVIMRQLGEFREPRAVRDLEWICDNCPDFLAKPARAALEQIQE